MKETEFINIIKKQTASEFIGDDCAYLKDLGIVVTQDNFVEGVHFKREWMTPFQIGYKATVVNISDILASGAKPEYVTLGLSLPKNTTSDFIKEFYDGVNSALHGAKITGGDITSADKIFISITAIGSVNGRNISSRGNAEVGNVVITTGEYGSSAEGLKILLNHSLKTDKNIDLIKAHLEPKLNETFSRQIAEQTGYKYAMMDTSDGLADALFKIAAASDVTLKVEFDKIPHNKLVNDKNSILFGGEDYNLVAVVNENILKNLSDYVIIGKAEPKMQDIKFFVDDIAYKNYDELKIYNHFEG